MKTRTSTTGMKSNMDKNPSKAMLPRQFGKIILTLENCLLSENKLQETPSQHDGLDKEVETDLRVLGCELIQVAGILLKLPQVAMATGQVLFQRFYYSKSYLRHNMETTAMSCICLASKIEEAPRRIRDVINVFNHIKQVRGQKPIQPVILDANYIALKTQVIKAERRVLKELGFCVHVKHPHKLIVMYLQVLGYEKNKTLMQMAWNFMNDSLRTDVFVRYNPESIACACIYLTARKINLPLPNNPPWYGVFNVIEDDILDICYKIMDLYRRPKPNAEALDSAVEKLKKVYEEIRNKNKTGQNTPPMAVTTVNRNDTSHNAWGGFISRAIPTVSTGSDNGKSLTLQQNASINNTKYQVTQSQQLTTDLPVNTNQANQPVSQQQMTLQKESSNSKTLKRSFRLSRDEQLTKRSHSRSSRSASLSHSPNKSRNHKKTRHRSRSRSRTPQKNQRSSSKKKSTRKYSRSSSLSPSRYNKKRDRDEYTNSHGERSEKKRPSVEKHRRERSRDKSSKHDRYSSHANSSGGGHRSSKHQDRFRDRKR